MDESSRRHSDRSHAFLRRVLSTCALVVGGLLIAWLVVKSLVHDEIRSEIERIFVEHYPQYRVSIRGARLIEDRGVEIHGLSIADRSNGRPLLLVSEMFAACPIDVQALLSSQRPPASRVCVSGLKLRAERREDGSWDVGDLWPLPEFGPHRPPVVIRDAVIEVVRSDNGEQRSLHARDVRLEVIPGDLTAASEEGPLDVRGTFAGDHVESIEFQARWDPRLGTWSAAGTVKKLRLSPDLLAAMPADIRDRATVLSPLSGYVDLQFEASSREQAGQSDSANGEGPDASATVSEAARFDNLDDVRFSVSGSLRDGRIRDARLPAPLHDVKAEFHLSNAGMRISNLFARQGASTLCVRFQRGWQPDSPFTLQAEARQWEFNQRLVKVLPPEYQAVWRTYFPAGVVDADLRLVYDGTQLRPEFEVRCCDVSFEYDKFPYRLEQTRGVLRMTDDILTIDLSASAGGQSVLIQGQLEHPRSKPLGWIDIRCEQPIPIDRKLLAAVVDPQAQAVIRALRPAGSVAVSGRFERRDPGAETISKQVTLQFVNCTMQYDKFPYPLAMINGRCVWNDEGWFFHDLSGRNGSGYIECQGSWQQTADGDGVLNLDFVGADVLLADELRDALSPGAQRLWNQLQPRGTIDHLSVGLQYTSRGRELTLDVAAQKYRRQDAADGRSITLRPQWFPYRLDDVSGGLQYRDGEVQLHNISAIHGQTEIGIGGHCLLRPEGGWQVQLTRISADRVHFDRDLLEALPANLGTTIGKLNLEGDIHLLGALNLAGHAEHADATTAAWNVTLDIENGGIDCGLHLDHMHGEVTLAGSSNRKSFASRGELNFDSMFYKGIHLTQVRGPLFVDASGVVLGAGAEHDVAGRAPRTLSAQTLGGQLTADAAASFSDEMPYHLQARLEGVDLQRMSRELALQTEGIRGKANGVLNLHGNRHGWPSWRGDGAIRLYEADIYQLPAMLSLLSLLGAKRPDSTAFSSSEIDFRIQGEHLYLDRINFNGDAISLKGHGEMNLDRRIDLKFYALVGRGELPLPALRALLRQASRQMLLIQVTGTLEKPQFTQEPLPMLRETLDQIFPEPTGRERLSRLPPLQPSTLLPSGS